MWKSNVRKICTKNIQKIRNVNMFRKYVEFKMWQMCCFYATWFFFMLLQVQKIWQNWMWKSNVNIFFVQACPKNMEKIMYVDMSRKYVKFQMWKVCCFYATWCCFIPVQVQKIWQKWMWKSNVNIFCGQIMTGFCPPKCVTVSYTHLTLPTIA